MQHSGFFESEYDAESQSYDREYLAEQFAQYFSLFIGNGVFISPADQLKVIAGEGLKVIVTEGWAFINGLWYHNDADLELNVTPNTESFSRTDSVMCRLNTAEREITSIVLSNETDVTRDGNYYDLKLAEISIAVASTAITTEMITDTRMNESVCGFVKGLVDVVSTEELFNQYDAAFSAWFERIKGQLSTDAAGNLQNQIDIINGTVVSQWLESESFIFGGNRFLDSSGIVVDAQGRTLENELTQLNSSITEKLGDLKLVALTQAEYDALETKDTNTLYFIKSE